MRQVKINIFTDGSCSGNPGPGGWGVVINLSKGHRILSGNSIETTNNRMELQAVVETLKLIKSKVRIGAEYVCDIHSDSAYVINAITKKWIEVWKINGWKKKDGDAIKNVDLWKDFYFILEDLKATKNVTINFIKVKGHAGNTFNELVDKIARGETEKAKREREGI